MKDIGEKIKFNVIIKPIVLKYYLRIISNKKMKIPPPNIHGTPCGTREAEIYLRDLSRQRTRFDLYFNWSPNYESNSWVGEIRDTKDGETIGSIEVKHHDLTVVQRLVERHPAQMLEILTSDRNSFYIGNFPDSNVQCKIEGIITRETVSEEPPPIFDILNQRNAAFSPSRRDNN